MRFEKGKERLAGEEGLKLAVGGGVFGEALLDGSQISRYVLPVK